MGTTYSKSFVEQVIAHKGVVQGRPPCLKIVRYENLVGRERWGVVYANDPRPDRYERPNKLRQNQSVIWTNPDPQWQAGAEEGVSAAVADAAESEREPVLQEA